MRGFPAILVVLLSGAVPLQAQNDSIPPADSATAAAVRTLLELSGTASLMLMGMEEALAENQDEMPPGFLEEFKGAVKTRIPEFLEMLVPIYAAAFSLDEVQRINEFLRTPLGQRFVSAQPEITRATMKAAERWGMLVAGEVVVDMARKGKSIR